MFVNIQLPFADLRPLLDEDVGRLPLPGWPNPQVDSEFVRSVGAVRQRRAGGAAPWMGEGYFADATRALRFPPQFARWPYGFGWGSTTMRNVFRRFFSDGRAVTRIEVGFAPRNRNLPLEELDGQGLLGLIAACLSVPVRLKSADDGKVTTELVLSGRELARHLIRATTRNGARPPVEPWCVRSLRPIAIATYAPDEVASIPRGAKEVKFDEEGHRAHHLLVARHGVTVPVWLISEYEVEDQDQLRRLRLHLARLHAEREVFKWTLSCASQGKLAGPNSGPAWDRLQGYLNDTDRLLTRGSIFGFATPDLRTALGLEDLVNPGERESLLGQLRGMRGNVFRKVEAIPSQKTPPQIVFIQKQIAVNEQIGDIHMDDNSISIGDVSGEIHGVIGNENYIANSFQRIEGSEASGDVKTTLKELVQAVEELKPKLGDQEREAATRDLGGLVNEATAPKPRRGILESLGDGLVQTAKSVGEVGLPVLKLVTQLVALFA